MSERRNDLARGDIMECAGRALSGDGALAPGVANSVLIEAITCGGRSANGFTASSPEHAQDLRTLAKDKTWLPNPSNAVVIQHPGIQHVGLAAGKVRQKRVYNARNRLPGTQNGHVVSTCGLDAAPQNLSLSQRP